MRSRSLGGALDISGDLAVERSHLEEIGRQLDTERAALEERC